MTLTLFPEPGPRVFTVPPGLPFAKALADGVLTRLVAAGGDAAELADLEIIVSTERAVRALRSAFVAAARDRGWGAAVLGPRLTTLGGLSHDAAAPVDAPPAINGTRRLLILTRLVRALLENEPSLGAPSVASSLAADLSALLDSVQAAGVSLDALDAIGGGEHAAHWALSRQFLEIIRAAWPALLAAEQRLDPEDRRRQVVAALGALWAEQPATKPMIVAGSTGSLDTSAWFIALIAALPQGAVVLPGLDRAMDAAAASAIADGQAPEHPQSGLYALCRRIGVAPGAVPDWSPDPRPHAAPRLALLSQSMRPAPVTDAWRENAADLAGQAGAATEAMALIEADSPREEAAAIAVALREALETPGRRAALITPDRTLARRVAAELARWRIAPDDSSGRPLALTAPGVFFSLVADVALNGMKPAALLAMLKHPICAAGFTRGQHVRVTRRFERWVLRADRLAAQQDLTAAIAAADAAAPIVEPEDGTEPDPAMTDWWAAVQGMLAPLLACADGAPTLSEVIEAHAQTAAALSQRSDQSAPELFARAAGESLAGFIEGFAAAAEGFGPLPPTEYPGLLGQLMAGEAVREAFGRHPRIAILGPLEARMQTADLVVLAGLNDGVWPQIPEPDPWISRDMRALMGLPPLESRIGLSAHDFFQAAMASTVVLSRSRRSDGSPTTPSRWLLRMTTLLNGVAPETLSAMAARGERYVALGRMLDQPSTATTPAPRPRPAPPLPARPRKLSATEVEVLIRDPYAVYARRVLRLTPLPDLSDTPDARDRGDLLHQLVERFVRAYDGTNGPALYDQIMAAALAPIAAWPSLHALWTARARAMRDWFLAGEDARRASGRPLALEARGVLALDTVLGEVQLTAFADRIDQLEDGSYAVYDYKTGQPPSAKEVAHFAKQLPLEAAILAMAGFEGAAPGPVAKLAYLHMRGGKIGGAEVAFDRDVDKMAEDAIAGLAKLLARYGDPDQPYLSRARPKLLSYASDYDHLARFGEWSDGA